MAESSEQPAVPLSLGHRHIDSPATQGRRKAIYIAVTVALAIVAAIALFGGTSPDSSATGRRVISFAEQARQRDEQVETAAARFEAGKLGLEGRLDSIGALLKEEHFGDAASNFQERP